MRNNTQGDVTFEVAGASVTLDAAALAKLWTDSLLERCGAKSVCTIATAQPRLKPGEIWLGAIITADASKRRHIILLPDLPPTALKWQAAMDWAASIGGELFDRTEGALFFATMKSEFKPEWYWTREQLAGDDSCAWCQDFGNGGQLSCLKSSEYLARAVRSEAIQ